MWLGRIGGTLVVCGFVLIVIVAAIAVGGGAVGVGLSSLGSLIYGGALALAGCGTAVLSVGGPRPLHGRAVRIALGILAVGLLSSLASTAIAAGMTSDPLESLPFIALFLLGVCATVVGWLVTGLSLVRAPGPSRKVGSVFLASILLLVLAATASAMGTQAPPLQAIGWGLGILGVAAVILGGAGVGVLAIKGDLSPAHRAQE